jgi:tripartite-type tricarboxylate transporter receptor subunit TctC
VGRSSRAKTPEENRLNSVNRDTRGRVGPTGLGSDGRRRRDGLKQATALLCAAAMPLPGRAQSFPSDKPVWVVVPFGAGGAVDLIARSLATDLAKSLGPAVNVENRVGAGGNIAAAHVARSAPDGHVIMVGGTGNAIAKQIFANLPYDPMTDLTPIAMLGMAPSVLLVSASLPTDDVRGLVAMAKAKPGSLTIAHGGAGTVSEHLAGELFKLEAGIDMTTVPYKGGAAAMTDIIGGQVTCMFTNLLNAMPHLQSGRMKALAVTSSQRVASIPAVPTMKESGFPDFEVFAWWCVLGPGNLSAPIVDRLNKDISIALASGTTKARLETMSARPVPMTPAQFKAFFTEEGRKWTEVARKAGITPQ